MIEIRRANGTLLSEYVENGSRILGVICSGMGYTLQSPLLYYTKRLMLSKGMDYVGIDLRYRENPAFMDGDARTKERLFEADRELIAKILSDVSINYDMIIMAGKSMGTTLTQRCLKEKEIMAKASLIHLTPGTAWRDGIEMLKGSDIHMLLVGSTADKHYRVENLHEIYQKKNLTLVEFDNCNHLLETEDLFRDIERVEVIMNAMDGFIKDRLATGR